MHCDDQQFKQFGWKVKFKILSPTTSPTLRRDWNTFSSGVRGRFAMRHEKIEYKKTYTKHYYVRQKKKQRHS